MTVQDKIDTKFLKDTVADVVVKACSACAVARPEDPVGFVAGWLDQFVANDAILKKRSVELTERAAVEAEEEEVRHPETFARGDTRTRASRRRRVRRAGRLGSPPARPVPPVETRAPIRDLSRLFARERIESLPPSSRSRLSRASFSDTSSPTLAFFGPRVRVSVRRLASRPRPRW